MTKYRIYEDESHHLGLISEDGMHRIPAVYDEIQISENGTWDCRVFVNWDYFYPSSGKCSVHRRTSISELEDWIEDYESLQYKIGKGPTTVEDRVVYDSISKRKTSRYIFTYEHGKFGVKSLDGVVILDSIYDEVDVWENANVIQSRLGENYYYINNKGERILTDLPSCMEQNIPYWDGLGLHKFMVREMVDQISDNHTYVSDAGFVRIDRMEVKDVAAMLAVNCERIPMKPEAIKLLTDRYSYEFGMSIIGLSAGVDGTITDAEWEATVNKLETIGAFRNSWHYIDKFVTNSKTKLSVKSLYWLKHRYDMKYVVLDDLYFAYGIDDTLADGEVKWIHVEHYNEHCFPGGYDVCGAMEYGTLDELKERIEAYDWEADGDPYGGCFFSFRNIRYPDGRLWDETEKILNYMLELGHKPKDLVICIVEKLGRWWSDDVLEETKFWVKCAEWALAKIDFPNELDRGETCYDQFLKIRSETESEEIQAMMKYLDKLFLARGARTSEQQVVYNWKEINGIENPYDYSVVESW